MASTISSANLKSNISSVVQNDVHLGKFTLAEAFSTTLKDSSGNFLFDRSFGLVNYSLTVAASPLDIDVYDLASLDIGNGAGRDNVGETHANARIIAWGVQNRTTTAGTQVLTIDGSGLGATHWNGFFPDSTSLAFNDGAFFTAFGGTNGWTVTDSTSHVIRLVASVATVSLDFFFFSKQS